MISAHTLGSGGPDLELFTLAAGLAVLGVITLFQRSVKPAVGVLLLAGAVGSGAAAFALGGQQRAAGAPPEGAEVRIISPRHGATVPANRPIEIRYELDKGSDPSLAGDMHVYVDGELQSMQMGEVLTVRVPPGRHTIGVELAANDHTSFNPPVIDEVEVVARR